MRSKCPAKSHKSSSRRKSTKGGGSNGRVLVFLVSRVFLSTTAECDQVPRGANACPRAVSSRAMARCALKGQAQSSQ
ncbi:hypothetical protein IE81DRAFT_322946 [Ceraceosorus guamensis]|uniref:Uncharacterized protein n=1 Tax=Ceraceosorus guamensis TaxID=1522189 RepID=A0A316W009_9BASI|nr:hypothetical protein IE81DRAFT_322946 [Ceraceosorus guamensis]PWN43019.1 hypothetical protein IE81DRAFT_322946 [Ceraceosorus guamensis]